MSNDSTEGIRLSTRPYFIRALYEWAADAGYTPHIVVQVDTHTKVPMGFVKQGEIVLNIAMSATDGLNIDNEAVSFQARFGGVAHNIYVPIGRIAAFYAKETGEGMGFEVEDATTENGGLEWQDKSAKGAFSVVSSHQSSEADLPEDSERAASAEADGTPPTEPTPPKKSGGGHLKRIK